MQVLISRPPLGALALLLVSSGACAATVTLTVLDSAGNPRAGNLFTPGETVVVDVSGSGFPGDGLSEGLVGASLKVSFDAAKLSVLTPANTAGVILAPGSAFVAIGGAYTTNFVSCGIPVSSCSFSGAGHVVNLAPPATGAMPFGSFDAFRIKFVSSGSAGGSTMVALKDDQNILSWTDYPTFEAIPVTYNTAVINFVPIPAALWLLCPALGVLGYLRRRVPSN